MVKRPEYKYKNIYVWIHNTFDMEKIRSTPLHKVLLTNFWTNWIKQNPTLKSMEKLSASW